MASIAKDKNGTRRILFVAPDGRRPTIRLGKVSQRAAEGIKYRVEQLLEALNLNRPMEADLAAWVADLEPRMAKKLANAGLIPKPEAKAAAALGPFLDDFIDRRNDVKPASKVVWRHTARNLRKCFGKDRDLASITPGDAEDFKLFLVDLKLAPTTVGKRLQFASQFFGMARKRRLIPENPFSEVKIKALSTSERQFFVTREVTERILEHCNPTWRIIVSLARYGGLRSPSEVLSLKWEGVNWAAGRITVESPKTEHHGKATRVIPMFPELRPVLQDAYELAPKGTVYVVDADNYRAAAMGPDGWRNCNLRTQFERILRRAGVPQWPKLFQNLRSSRETELAAEHPIHVVTAWMGNTPRIAMKHYLQVTDADFDRAVQRAGESGAQSGARVAQNAAQPGRAANGGESQDEGATPLECAVFAASRETQLVATKELSGEDRIRTCGGLAPSRI